MQGNCSGYLGGFTEIISHQLFIFFIEGKFGNACNIFIKIQNEDTL